MIFYVDLADILLTLKEFEKLKKLEKNGGGKEKYGLSEITMCDTFLDIEKLRMIWEQNIIQ